MSARPIIKTVAIIGGTGTLGQAITAHVLEQYPAAHIKIISRSEHKQAEMRRKFPMCQYAIGDVKDYDSIAPHLIGRELVFHTAAMKHVEICEANPQECLKVNIQGTINVANACIAAKVPYMVFSSTDKAVDPINAYGVSKKFAEHVLFDLNKTQKLTKFSVYRWGNIIGSQGSVIPQFIHTLQTEKKAYITHLAMTRFWLPIEWPVRFMLRTFNQAYTDQVMVPPVMKSSTVVDIIRALAEMLGISDFALVDIGMRPGEKLHEAMHSVHSDQKLTSYDSEFFTMDELKELLSPLVHKYALEKAA